MMDCPDKTTLFNYHNHESDESDYSQLYEHIRDCERCAAMLDEIAEEISLVNEALDFLEPVSVPEPPAIHEQTENMKALQPEMRPEQSGLSALGWRDAARAVSLAAALLIILIGGLLLKKNGHPDFQTLYNIALMEQQFMSDPKEDFRENSMYITEYNAVTGELTIVRQTAAGDTTDTKVVVFK